MDDADALGSQGCLGRSWVLITMSSLFIRVFFHSVLIYCKGMISTKRNFSQILLSFAVVALLLISAGLPHFGMTMSMDMDGNMTMTDCYMPGMTAICNMTPLEHVASWQSMFTSTPVQSFMLLLLSLVLTALVGFLWTRQEHSPPLLQRKHPVFSRRREYIPQHTSLQELFSQGILNPKLF